MKVLDLGHLEAQFGLIIREKENHDNYALLRFEDLDKVVEYYKSFRDDFTYEQAGRTRYKQLGPSTLNPCFLRGRMTT